MKMTLEKEFQLVKTMRVFNKVVEKIEQYSKDIPEVDIPEFCKLPEDRIAARADRYVAQIITEGRLDEVYNKIVNV